MSSKLSFIVFSIFLIILRFADLSIFSFWDEPTYTTHILTQSWEMFLPGSELRYSITPHIFGYSLTLFIAKTILGGTIFSLRLLSFINFLFLLLGIKKLLEKNTNLDYKSILIAIFGICLIPIIFTYITIIMPDMFIATIGIWAWIFYSENKLKSFLMISIYGSLFFEPIQAFFLPLYLNELLLFRKKSSKRDSILRILAMSAPLSIYLCFNFFEHGRFLHHNILDEKGLEGLSVFSISIENLVVLKKMTFSILQQVFIPLITILLFLVFKKQNFKRHLLTPILLTSLSFIIFWTIFSEFHPRNLISIYILIYTFFIFTLSKLKKKFQVVLYSIFILSSLMMNFTYKSWFTPDSQYITYKDAISITQEAINYIEQNNINYVTCDWPLSEQIDLAFQAKNKEININRFYQTNNFNKGILIINSFNELGFAKNQYNIVSEKNLKLIFKKVIGDYSLEIYE